MTYQIGIVGYGGFGRFLHHCWNKLDGVSVAAVSDRSFHDDAVDGVIRYHDWQDLLENQDIDIVSIATPPAFHVEMACRAMRKNKHVLLEKPIAITTEGAEEILKVQKETGKVIMVNHMLRYDPIVKLMMQFGRQEIFGKLRHVELTNYAQDSALPSSHWFWDKELSGGIFIEHGVHFFDIVNGLTNQQFVDVSAHAHSRNEKQQDQVAAMVEYSEGLIANFYHSFSGPGFFEKTTLRLNFDLAKFEIEGWVPMKGKFTALVNELTREELSALPGFSIDNVQTVRELADSSRPEGWGASETETSQDIFCGGVAYDVEQMLSGTFEIHQSKGDIYSNCLQEI
ncbi:MAG: Gfo/Idh/MocA family oxidoreductase, partial [Sphingobacteriales bacterium]